MALLVMSPLGGHGDLGRFQRAGFAGYVLKPVFESRFYFRKLGREWLLHPDEGGKAAPRPAEPFPSEVEERNSDRSSCTFDMAEEAREPLATSTAVNRVCGKRGPTSSRAHCAGSTSQTLRLY